MAVTVLYVGALVWLDARNDVFANLPKVLDALPVLAGITLLSYLLRYLRWYWLLQRAGHYLPWTSGFAAYVSGSAFTATPGKVGELVRIRYFLPMKVPPSRVIAAFVYERGFDLITVLLLSTALIKQSHLFITVLSFVLILLSVVITVARRPHWLGKLAAHLRLHGFRRLAGLSRVLRDGLSGCRIWMTGLDAVVSLLLGLLAWGAVAVSFLWLLSQLGIAIPALSGIAIYPLAMLAGAASMLPGGVGSTEITIIALLAVFDVPLELAALAAIAIRFSTLWFAVMGGFISVGVLELERQPRGAA
ncbi:MAG TPA: lysylphosphatidylglycerol synthase transmembrane domain-containing protein [Burkholderiaceae bacterium]|nr:lysylphosphatidylglycerol synthase transmembrane domain-containing protein [Burkholderiaceae bacterium]